MTLLEQLTQIAYQLQTVSTLGHGAIYIVRGETWLGNYGAGDLDAIERGEALSLALADLVAGDMLITGPGLYSVSQESFAVPNVTWIAHGTTLIPLTASPAYAYILRLATGADYTTIDGLRVWDKDGVGTSTSGAAGIQVQASNCTLKNCWVQETTGTGANSGEGFSIFGSDNTMQNCVAYKTGFAGLQGSCNRFTMDGCIFYDCGILNGSPNTRSVNYQGSTAYDWVKISNCKFIAKIQDSSALVNFNHSNSMKHLTIENCMWLDDGQENGTTGASFNTTSREQQLKLQRIDKVDITNCDFKHGTNDGTGYVVSVSADSPYPTEINFEKCTFSDACLIDYSTRFEKVTYRYCQFGLDDQGEKTGLVGIMSGRAEFDRCLFNLGTTETVAFYALNIATVAGDHLKITNCEFVGNNSSNIAMIGTGGYISSNARPIISYNNKMTNNGAGGTTRTTDQDVNLLLNTDPNGDMLYDASDSDMPSPGSGPNYFTSPAVPGFQGQKIWNVEWDDIGTDQVQMWWYNGSNWIAGHTL